MMTLIAAIQIIEVIIIRAEDDLSAYIPGIWSRLASFFKTLLAELAFLYLGACAAHILLHSTYNPFFTVQDLSSPDIHLRLQ